MSVVRAVLGRRKQDILGLDVAVRHLLHAVQVFDALRNSLEDKSNDLLPVISNLLCYALLNLGVNFEVAKLIFYLVSNLAHICILHPNVHLIFVV